MRHSALLLIVQRHRRIAAALVVVGLLTVLTVVKAAPAEDMLPPAASGTLAWGEQDAVEGARDALGREGFPWYDNREDALRPVRVSTPWNIPDGPSVPRPSLWGVSFWEVLLFAFLGIVLLTVTWLIIRAYLNREEAVSTGDSTSVRQAAVDDAARIEALPFRIRRRDIDLLAEARRLYGEGKFAEAIIYLFSHQLVEMDRHQVIRLAKGKTNRQYLRDLRRRPPLRAIIERSMVAFEDVFFGGHSLDRARFESVWQQLHQFDSLIAEQAPA
ncbi:MAG TPA: DUF4129 domain-containing protein [Pirellulales bacterium]|nr:DUF4129 domain-containing protein [Pirellulales bacterium]